MDNSPCYNHDEQARINEILTWIAASANWETVDGDEDPLHPNNDEFA